MKARIRKTGETINIADYARVTLESCDSHGNPLEYPLNEVDIIEEKSSDVDWERIRIKAAISALQGFASNPHNQCVDADTKSLARWSVGAADCLIDELKKEHE